MEDLSDITQRLGEAHRRWKEAEKAKNDARDEFFRAIKESAGPDMVAQGVEEIEAVNEEEALRVAQRRFHRHKVLDVVEQDVGRWKVILEEDLDYRPYQYVNPIDGQVYSKIIAENAPSLDDEALQTDHPDLWNRITREVYSRELLPLEELDPEDVEALQPYITIPKPSIRMGNPRKATSEELDGAI